MQIQHDDQVVSFQVRVIPRSSRSEVVGEHDGVLKVKLASPPVDGAANEELIKLMAKTFAVPKSSVKIVSGHTSKAKKVSVTGASSERIDSILQAKS